MLLVRYNIFEFIDKNKDPIFQDFKRLLYNRYSFIHSPVISIHYLYCSSQHAILRDMWPEGAQAVTEVTKRPKSTGTIFKESMIALVANLKTKVRYKLTSEILCVIIIVNISLKYTAIVVVVVNNTAIYFRTPSMFVVLNPMRLNLQWL